MSGRCEWNPEKNRPSAHGEHVAEATWAVGAGMNNWHLCDNCARLPRFKRFRKRQRISDKYLEESFRDE